MGDLLIRNMSDALKADLERKARENGRSLSEEAKAQIRRSLASEDMPSSHYSNAYEAIRSAFEEAGAIDDEYAKIMEEIEVERKRDFGRPVPDFE